MQSESVISVVEVDRTATLRLVRVVDFEAIAAEHDGAVPIDELKNGGTFQVQIEPNGKGDHGTWAIGSAAEGIAYMDGFAAAVALKKKGPRKPKNGAKDDPTKTDKSKRGRKPGEGRPVK